MKTTRLAICSTGLLIAFAQQAHAQSVPVPELGCHVFNTQGRALRPAEMTDKQLLQAMNCTQVSESQATEAQSRVAFNQQSAQTMSDLTALNDRMQARAAGFATQPVQGYAGRVATPLPGNTPLIAIQAQ